MILKREINTDNPESIRDNPDLAGELLRERFFRRETYGSYGRTWVRVGCYEIFEWAEDVKSLPPRVVRPEYAQNNPWLPGDFEEYWTRGELGGVICEYFWDGDGTLRFILPDGLVLINTDCKKDHGWFIDN